MGFLSFLAGNSGAVDKVVSAGISGIDKLVFTEEEKADYNRKLQTLHLEFVKIAATESTAQSISRRLICMPVVYVWLALIVANVGCEIFLGTAYSTIADAIQQMNMPALAAIGFYVGRHMVSNKK